MTKIKICGLRRPEDIAAVNRYRPDYAGFVFAPGRRQVTPAQAAALVQELLPEICPVGVFVNAPEEMICGLVEAGTIRVIQFHGQETERTITRMKRRYPDVPVIRAVSMKQGHELGRWDASDADYLLLDAGNGGTGHMFDHSLITQAGAIQKPWFLAGGMQPDNVQEAIASFAPFGIDCSSGVETEGWKDPFKIRRIIENVRGFVPLKIEL